MAKVRTNYTYFMESEVSALGLNVRGCGHFRAAPGTWRQERRSLACYCLNYLVDGRGWFQSQGTNKQELKPGSVSILFPGDWHEYAPNKGSFFEVCWWLFDGFSIDRVCEEGLLVPEEPVWWIGPCPELKRLHRESMRLATKGPAEERFRMCGLFFQALGLVAQRARRATLPTAEPRIRKLVSRIQSDPARDWDFHALARQSRMSYELLRKLFSKTLGVPPQQFLLRERVRLACRHLAAGNSVAETCYNVGLRDPYYFSRTFKRHMGVSPRQYVNTLAMK